MNKKEIAEIKKLYGIKNCSIQRLAIGYIDAEKELKCVRSESFLNLPEEEMFKYLDILKKGMSGKVGKNICTLEYETDQESHGSMHESLMQLRSSGLQNEEMLKSFYEKVAENYPEVENVAVILVYNVYDVPGKGEDEFKNIDASEEIYEYISCYFCPVKLEDPGLVYNGERFEHKDRRWEIAKPIHGFIFPSFEDRSADIHCITIYNKKPNGQFDSFDKELLGLNPILSADEQKESFASALENAVMNCEEPINVVSSIHEAIVNEMEENNDINMDLSYDKLSDIVKEAGVSDEDTDSLIEELRETMNDKPLKATNIVDKKTKIKSSDMEIKIDVDNSSNIEKREIDGRVYLLVPLSDTSDIEVNGVKLGSRTEIEEDM